MDGQPLMVTDFIKQPPDENTLFLNESTQQQINQNLGNNVSNGRSTLGPTGYNGGHNGMVGVSNISGISPQHTSQNQSQILNALVGGLNYGISSAGRSNNSIEQKLAALNKSKENIEAPNDKNHREDLEFGPIGALNKTSSSSNYGHEAVQGRKQQPKAHLDHPLNYSDYRYME